MYAHGTDAPQDYLEGLKWFRLAAKQGHAMAQVQLAQMYGGGRGVPQNFFMSYVWNSLALTEGAEILEEQSLDRLRIRSNRDLDAQRLTAEQLLEAQQFARRCFESYYQDCE